MRAFAMGFDREVFKEKMKAYVLEKWGKFAPKHR
jgi:hypothetical protein